MRIGNHLVIDESALDEHYIRASGPGGQHVNKTATAVQLRLDLSRCDTLPGPIKLRLRKIAGQRLTDRDEILIEASRFRSREQNRRDARERLAELIEQAARTPKRRKPTRPSRAAKARRTDKKTRRGHTKTLRKPPGPSD